MKRRIGLTHKVTGVFVLFAALLLAIVGSLAYKSGRAELQKATIDNLLSVAAEKESLLDRWLEKPYATIVSLAAMPGFADDLAKLATAGAGSAATFAAHAHLVRELRPFTGRTIMNFFVMAPETGRIMVSTDPDEVGRFKEDRPYFINGKNGPYVQGPENSIDLGVPTITIAAPVKSSTGRLLGVLAGRLNLDDMSTIINRKTDLDKTENSYLVNRSGLFVTQPRFISDRAVLRLGIHTEAVERGLRGESGHILTRDYRGVPTITVYRWLPTHKLCLVVERDQKEAFAPSQTFGKVMIVISLISLLFASLAALGLARTITRPILSLRIGAARFGRGETDVRLPDAAGDELGDLAREFNLMAKAISEREAALRQSGERHRTILQTAMDGIWLVDMQGRLLEVNEAYCRMSGYNEQELLAMRIPDLEAAENADDTAAHIQKIMAQGEDRFESRHRRKDGSHFDVEVSVQYQTEYGGQLVVFLHDITERKQTEEALRESEEKYRNLFNNAEVGIFRSRLDGSEVLEINKRCLEIVGMTLEETLGKPSVNLWVDPKEREEMVKILVADGSVSQFEYRMLNKRHGEVRNCITSLRLYREQGMLEGSILDITERKHAEEALQTSERKYRTLTEQMPDFIWHKDRNGIYIYCNRRYAAALGRTPETIAGHRSEDFHPPELANKYLADDQLVIATGQSLETEEMWQVNGKKRWLHTSKVALLDESGQCIGTIGIGRDITDRKQVEEENRSLQERLQRAEKMEALGTLAGGVAHDLNNVLGIVVGYAGMLLDDVDETSPIHSDLMNILSGGEKAAEIVQDLLTLARRGVSNRKVLNLSRIVADYRNSPEFKTLSSYHPSVQIRIDLEPNTLNLSGSSVHIGKTLFNLVSNGCEAMPNGGVLTIRTTTQYIDKPIQGYDDVREGDYVVLSVSDTGGGIPAADLKRIFEPFYTKKVMGRSGTGLGLAVVWGTVKDHNGYINAESEEGKGSTFTLYFPVTREEITADQAAVPVSEYMGRGESILIVDDVKGQRNLAAAMLGKLNYSVATVSSGEEAVAYVKEQKIDLLVLDMIMDPGMDGLDTYRGILEIRPKQKAIIVSGFSETDRVKEAQELGAGAYVKKPYIPEILGLAVRKELDRK